MRCLYFISEQAKFLMQANGKKTKDIKVCEQAVDFLVDGNKMAMRHFNELLDTTKHDPDADYDTKDYSGKDDDIRTAITELADMANSPCTQAEHGKVLIEAAQMIAEFYCVGGELPGAV
jgi:hypothetical protein